MKKEIDILKESQKVLSKLDQGVLLTTKYKEKVNTMTIGWGTIGIEWGLPIFIAFVRTSRYTKEMLDRSKEFIINAPVDQDVKSIIGYCGTRSGKDHDKIKEMNLTLVPGETVNVPAIKELPLTLECEVLYSQNQELHKIPAELQKRYYPQDVDSSVPGSNQDIHVMYIAHIKKAYILD